MAGESDWSTKEKIMTASVTSSLCDLAGHCTMHEDEGSEKGDVDEIVC